MALTRPRDGLVGLWPIVRRGELERLPMTWKSTISRGQAASRDERLRATDVRKVPNEVPMADGPQE
jgi:hypothetical protein